MSDPSGGSSGFKKWVYVGNKPSAQAPVPQPPAEPAAQGGASQSDLPNALSGSYSPPSKAEAAAAVERAGRILAAAAGALPPSKPVPAEASEAARLLMEIDQTIARLSSL